MLGCSGVSPALGLPHRITSSFAREPRHEPGPVKRRASCFARPSRGGWRTPFWSQWPLAAHTGRLCSICRSEFIVRPVPTDVSSLGVADNRTMTVLSPWGVQRGE